MKNNDFSRILDNTPDYSIKEISVALQRVVEGAFHRVRVRGEVSGFKRAASGHLYFMLKDEDAVLDACCWRPQAKLLSMELEDGMAVIATGRLTTFSGRSKYQMIVERVEFAGKGAILAAIEARRNKLAAEGLFDVVRKQPLPFLPELIGIVTSPTGAVIHDILDRLAERFPRHVLLWPVLVQGGEAAGQIASAIEGFNALPLKSTFSDGLRRPDLLIVARGGGSIEDLMPFNEEIVVRAAAASNIPLIAAVGHETDTTLIDFAADQRAPTPTAAAEIAVPVRTLLIDRLLDFARRILCAFLRTMDELKARLSVLSRGLGDPVILLGQAGQKLDDRVIRFDMAWSLIITQWNLHLEQMGARLPHPRSQLALLQTRIESVGRALTMSMIQLKRDVHAKHILHHQRLTLLSCTLRAVIKQSISEKAMSLGASWRVLDGVSYRATLNRGYAVIRNAKGLPVGRSAALDYGVQVEVEFVDGKRRASLDPS